MERKAAEELQRQRRPSRFEVIPAPDILKFRQGSDQLHPVRSLFIIIYYH